MPPPFPPKIYPSKLTPSSTQIATLLAIIKANGSTPNWKETKIPAGRTMQSTQKMYEGLKKQAASVEMVGADKQTPSKVMGPRKSPIKKRGAATAAAATSNGNNGNNGKRGRQSGKGGDRKNGNAATTTTEEDNDDEDDEDDDEGSDNKKKRIKVEKNGDGVFGEQAWGFGGV